MKTKKKELTTEIEAKITFIMEGEPTEDVDLVALAEKLKEQLGADNIVIKRVKNFVRG